MARGTGSSESRQCVPTTPVHHTVGVARVPGPSSYTKQALKCFVGLLGWDQQEFSRGGSSGVLGSRPGCQETLHKWGASN